MVKDMERHISSPNTKRHIPTVKEPFLKKLSRTFLRFLPINLQLRCLSISSPSPTKYANISANGLLTFWYISDASITSFKKSVYFISKDDKALAM